MTTAIQALEALNVEICRDSGAGHPDATAEHRAAYSRIMCERADEVRAAIAAARAELGTGNSPSTRYVDGIESALLRALHAPRLAA